MLRYSSAHKKHRANPQQKSFIGLAAASTYNHLKFYVFVILSKDYMFVRGTNPIKLFCGVGVKHRDRSKTPRKVLRGPTARNLTQRCQVELLHARKPFITFDWLLYWRLFCSAHP
jgi:hypothetical protein